MLIETRSLIHNSCLLCLRHRLL